MKAKLLIIFLSQVVAILLVVLSYKLIKGKYDLPIEDEELDRKRDEKRHGKERVEKWGE
ncbi:hypothetical protein HK405_005945, partial [Cladochytrium tenue]